MPTKVYVLNEAMAPTAPIYQRINKEERVKINKIPWYHPYLRITFTDTENKNITIRFKQNSNTIIQKDQIDAGILANEPFTQYEYKALEFRNGVITTNDPQAQRYLDAYPANESFKGMCPDVSYAQFKEYDKAVESKITNEAFKKRVKAANKIASLETLADAEALLLRLNGSFFQVPETMDERVTMLINYLDNAEEEGLDLILKKEASQEEKITVIIGRLVQGDMLSFDKTPNQVSKKDAAGKWIDVKSITGDTLEERKRLFVEYLESDGGNDLLADLLMDIDSLEKQAQPKKKKDA